MAAVPGHPRRHDLPLLAGTEDTEDIFLSTMSELDKELSNELKVDHSLWEYLQDKNLIKYQVVGQTCVWHLGSSCDSKVYTY